MKVITGCPAHHYVCDGCKKRIIEAVIELNFHYGSVRDGDKLDFCSDECFAVWVECKDRLKL